MHPLPVSIGYFRSAVTLSLAEVFYNPPEGVREYTDRGHAIDPGRVYIVWDLGCPRCLGVAKDEAEARRLAAEVKREESRKHTEIVGGRSRLSHKIDGPAVIWRDIV